jgi:hypothetical protein
VVAALRKRAQRSIPLLIPSLNSSLTRTSPRHAAWKTLSAGLRR